MASAFYEGCGGDDYGADRGAETFAEAHGDAVETVAIVFEGACACGDGFPEACAVEVEIYRWVLLTCPGGDGTAVGEGEDGSAEGVFEGYEPRGGEMVVIFEDGVFLDVGKGYVMAVRWRDRYGHSSTDAGNTPCFPDCCVNNYSSILFVERGSRAGRQWRRTRI